MPILSDGFYDWAVRAPGPPSNRYSWNTDMDLIILHSMVGYYATTRPPVWTGTVVYDGTLYQHFPVFAGLPHAGAGGNPYGPGFESEGGAVFPFDEPLTDPQVATWLRMIADMEAYTGKRYARGMGTRHGLVEHCEVAQTSCPSGRYAKLYTALEDDDLSQADKDRITKLEGHMAAVQSIVGAAGILAQRTTTPPRDAAVTDRLEAEIPWDKHLLQPDGQYFLIGIDALQYLFILQVSLPLSISSLNAVLGKHISSHVSTNPDLTDAQLQALVDRLKITVEDFTP